MESSAYQLVCPSGNSEDGTTILGVFETIEEARYAAKKFTAEEIIWISDDPPSQWLGLAASNVDPDCPKYLILATKVS